MLLSFLVFVIDHILSDQSLLFSFDFGIDHTNKINHVVVLYGLHHRWYPIESITIVQFPFRCRANLYNRPGHYPFSFFLWIAPLWSVMLLSSPLFIINYIQSNRSWQFSSDFYVDCNCTISYFDVLFSLRHIPYTVIMNMIFQLHFWRRVDLYDQSHHCPISYSS